MSLRLAKGIIFYMTCEHIKRQELKRLYDWWDQSQYIYEIYKKKNMIDTHDNEIQTIQNGELNLKRFLVRQ